MGRVYGDGDDAADGDGNSGGGDGGNNNNNNNSNGKGGGGFWHHYTVTPTNFVTLPVAKQRKRIGEFLDLLRIIRGPVRIRLARKLLDVPAGGRTVRMPVLQMYLSSTEPPNGVLEALRYEYTEDLGGGHPGLRIVSEGWRDMVVDPGDGSRIAARCLTLARVPYELPWAWVATGVFPACHEVALWIKPVPHREAVDRVRRKMSLVYEAAQHSRAAAEELAGCRVMIPTEQPCSTVVSTKPRDLPFYLCVRARAAACKVYAGPVHLAVAPVCRSRRRRWHQAWPSRSRP